MNILHRDELRSKEKHYFCSEIIELDMEHIITWAKENYDLIILLVSILGVLVSTLAVIVEMKKKKSNKKEK